jgi:hypothetical protein
MLTIIICAAPKHAALFESQWSIQRRRKPYNAIERYMGHQINSRTKRLYDHIRDFTIQAAPEALSSGHYEASAATPTLVE